MGSNTPPLPPTEDRLAAIRILKDKYLGGTNGGSTGGNGGNKVPHDQSTTQEVPSVEVIPPGGEGTRGTSPAASMDASDSHTIEGRLVSEKKPPLNPDIKWDYAATGNARRSQRGRMLAVALRIEFDPNCLNLSYAEKATLAGLEAPTQYQLAQRYISILNSAEYVGRRRLALDAFEAEMDVSTAVCLAEAAKRDPQYAVLRRRLRQMDERRRIGGDQREQFSQLMSFLHGDTDTVLKEAPKPTQQDDQDPEEVDDGQELLSDIGEDEAGEGGLPEQDDE